MNIKPINWYKIIMDLAAHKLRPEKIAQTIGCTRIAVLHWKNGTTEPNYTNGEKLLALWHIKTSIQIVDAPRMR